MVGGTSIASRRRRTVLDVAVPGGRIAFTERGSGVPILFLHGGTGTGAFDWGEIAERVARRGYRTIVPDLRGHGVSPNHEPELGVVRFGLDATHVLRAVGAPRAVHVGFSVGGNTFLALLARDVRPALALVTIGASARGDPTRVERIMTGPWPDYLTGLEHAVADRPEYWKHLRAQLARDWATNVDLTPGAGARITCPVLVCHGTADRVQPVEYAHHLAAHLPDAELWLAEGAGHAVQLDQPEAFLERLEEFLATALAPSRNGARSG
jgi:pimeloyl-ACP methyl ester carboxylesterase